MNKPTANLTVFGKTITNACENAMTAMMTKNKTCNINFIYKVNNKESKNRMLEKIELTRKSDCFKMKNNSESQNGQGQA